MNKKTYLGDGLYAQYDGYHVVLSTLREDVEHFVALDSDVIYEFMRFLEKVFGVKINVERSESTVARPESERVGVE